MLSIGLWAQMSGQYSTYYYQRASLFEELPVTPDDIIFIGNSITDGAEWCELFGNPHVKNRGISGDTTYSIYERLDVILKGHPAQIFLLVGTNNIPLGESVDSIATGIRRIVRKIKEISPQTQLYLQNILPVTPHYGMFQEHTSRWQMIPDINQAIYRIADEEQVTYVDLFTHFSDELGQMKTEYTNDGLHLLGKGYRLWTELIKTYMKK